MVECKDQVGLRTNDKKKSGCGFHFGIELIEVQLLQNGKPLVHLHTVYMYFACAVSMHNGMYNDMPICSIEFHE